MTETLFDEILRLQASGTDPRDCEEDLRRRYGRNCAVVVIDSVGFTRTTQESGILHALGRLAQKRALTLPVLEAHGCEHFITEADSIIALFPDVAAAVDAVQAAARALRAHRLMLSDEVPYRFGAGIGFGSLLITGGHGEFFGAEMNLASKLGEDTAEGDELLLTEAAYAALPAHRRAGFEPAAVEVSATAIRHFRLSLAIADHPGAE